MNIVMLLPQIVAGKNGGFVGGYVNSVINLGEALQRHAGVTVVAGVQAGTAESLATELRPKLHNARVVLLRMRSRPTTHLYFIEFALRSFWWAIRCRERTNVVYGHSGHVAHGLATSLVARAKRAECLHALYCPISEEFQHRRVSAIDRFASSLALRSVARVVAISENVRASIARFTRGKTDATVILPAIPDDFAALPAKAADTRLAFGFVGHHRPEKGFDLALDALKTLRDAGNNVQLIALTSGAESQGPAAAEVRAMIEARELTEAVRLVSGYKDIRSFYAEIDVMLIPFRGTRGPSDYPMVLLEALSLGVPVVCTGVGAVPEVVQHGVNGFLARDLTPAGFTDATVEAVHVLRRDPLKIREAAMRSAAQFRASAVAQATLEFVNNKTKHT